jgi:hypothetical protein
MAKTEDATVAIPAQALEQLQAVGVDGQAACHALIAAGINMLPAFTCRHHLLGQYEGIIGVIEDRIEQIPGMVPGVDIAVCPEDAH